LSPLHKMGEFLAMLKDSWALGQRYQDFNVE
jgi:2-dehydro-3-deoxyphosphooctonate aldolase (KDO 8-P synthase)